MGWLSDNHAFTKFRASDMWKTFKDNPWRLFTGFDPVSTFISNKILGRDDEAFSDFSGGPTGSQFRRAEAQGIDTDARRQAHQVSQIIGSFYGGAAIGNAFTPAAGAAGAGATDIGGAGSIIGGQFVPAGGYVSDAALASLGGAGGAGAVGAAGGAVTGGLGGSSAFLGGGGLSTSGVNASAINADILAGGGGSIGGGAVGGNGSVLSGQGGQSAPAQPNNDYQRQFQQQQQQNGQKTQAGLLELMIQFQQQAEERARKNAEAEKQRQIQFGMLL